MRIGLENTGRGNWRISGYSRIKNISYFILILNSCINYNTRITINKSNKYNKL